MADPPNTSDTYRELRSIRVWVGAFVAALCVAALSSTQQWAELKGTPKQMSWVKSFAYQSPSWLMLVPLTPVLLMVLRRWPIDRQNTNRVLMHVGLSVVFGVVFLLVAVPSRLAFHSSSIRWNIFGEAYYKSAPMFVTIGVCAYWLIALVASLVESRTRLDSLALALKEAHQPTTPPHQPEHEPAPIRVALITNAGISSLPPSQIVWIEPAQTGATVHTVEGAVDVRHTLTELDQLLARSGCVRVHRSRLANTAHIRELIGGRSRDSIAVMTTGDRVPVSRRRRDQLETLLARLTS